MKKRRYIPPAMHAVPIDAPRPLAASIIEYNYADGKSRYYMVSGDDEEEAAPEKSEWDMDPAEYFGYIRYKNATEFFNFEHGE